MGIDFLHGFIVGPAADFLADDFRNSEMGGQACEGMTQAVDSGEWDSGIFAGSFCAAAERFLAAFHNLPARLSGILDCLVKLRDQDRHVSDGGFVFCAVEQNPVSVLVHDPDAPDFDCEAVLASNDVRPIKAVNFRYANETPNAFAIISMRGSGIFSVSPVA